MSRDPEYLNKRESKLVQPMTSKHVKTVFSEFPIRGSSRVTSVKTNHSFLRSHAAKNAEGHAELDISLAPCLTSQSLCVFVFV